MGYQKWDSEIVDYQMYRLKDTKERFRGPKPENLNKEEYFVCLGAAQTLGRFCDKPYPTLLQEKLNMQSLNLSDGGAIPDWFLQKKEILEYTNNAKFAIIQVMSARTVSNSLFESRLTGPRVIQRDTGVTLLADEAYEELIQSQDWGQLKKIIAETRHNFVESYKSLLAEITVPKILFWFSVREPKYRENYENLSQAWQLWKAFPQLVNQEMIDQIKGDCDQYIQCISKRGLPQLLVSRFTGEPVTIANAQGELKKTHNNYYPSPEMHIEAANLLEPVCRKYSQTPISNNRTFLNKHKAQNTKTLVLFSIPRTGSTFLGKVINSLKEFEFLGEIYHPDKVIMPDRRKLRLTEYLYRQQGNKITIENGESDQDLDLLKFAHDFPDVFFAGMKNTTKSKYFGFKIFPQHLNLDTVNNIFLKDKSIIKLVLRRNILETYSSIRIANQLNQYHSINTSDIKITFKERQFTEWLRESETFYSFLEERAHQSPQEYCYLDYEEINQYESDFDKAAFIFNTIRKLGFDINQSQEFDDCKFLKKQDSRTNVLNRFENPKDVKRFVVKNNLEYLLDNSQPNEKKCTIK